MGPSASMLCTRQRQPHASEHFSRERPSGAAPVLHCPRRHAPPSEKKIALRPLTSLACAASTPNAPRHVHHAGVGSRGGRRDFPRGRLESRRGRRRQITGPPEREGATGFRKLLCAMRRRAWPAVDAETAQILSSMTALAKSGGEHAHPRICREPYLLRPPSTAW